MFLLGFFKFLYIFTLMAKYFYTYAYYLNIYFRFSLPLNFFRYFDFLSAYSAVNQGHCHPRHVGIFTHAFLYFLLFFL